MANYLASDTDLAAVADAIRTAGGTSGALEFPGEWVSAVAGIKNAYYKKIVPSASTGTLTFSTGKEYKNMMMFSEWLQQGGITGGIYIDGGVNRAHRYNTSLSYTFSVTYSNGVITVSTNADTPFLAGKTYHFTFFNTGETAL